MSEETGLGEAIDCQRYVQNPKDVRYDALGLFGVLEEIIIKALLGSLKAKSKFKEEK